MPLPDSVYEEIRRELDACSNPLFLFDDDPDGTASYLLLYRYKREGHGMPVKASPAITVDFLKKVDEHQADKVFVLDIPMIDQDFLDKVKVPVIWIDHHGPFERQHVKYYNPRVWNEKDITCTSENCYHVVKQDLWVAMIGIVGDWQFPPQLMAAFRKDYPDLLPASISTPEKALFASEIGRLVKIISFMLKGKISEVKKCFTILSSIKSPYEILQQTTEEGKHIFNRAEKVVSAYDAMLKEASKKKSKDAILLYLYEDNFMSFTKELSNELLYLFPEKIIVVGRKKRGEYKLSLRASNVLIRPVLEQALRGVQGYGGGHEHACGACVKEEDFDVFLKQLREELAVRQ